MCIEVSSMTKQTMIDRHDAFQATMVRGQKVIPIVGGVVCGALSLLAGCVVAIAVLLIKTSYGPNLKKPSDGQSNIEANFQVPGSDKVAHFPSAMLITNNGKRFAFSAANLLLAGIPGVIALIYSGVRSATH